MSGPPTAQVYRIAWVPGTDVLLGSCHCGAEHFAEDPAEMWTWLLGHPVDHERPARAATLPTAHGKDERRA